MIKIKYNDSDIIHEVEFSRTENTVTLKGIIEQNTSGFTTYRMSGEQLGDFSDFNTIYKVDCDSITYSNDSSIYEEPIKPTEEELKRQSLINEKTELETWLRNHDYVGTKIATGRASISEYADVIAEMNIKAERINEINKILNEHT